MLHYLKLECIVKSWWWRILPLVAVAVEVPGIVLVLEVVTAVVVTVRVVVVGEVFGALEVLVLVDIVVEVLVVVGFVVLGVSTVNWETYIKST